ncbi:MAG: hypothetical protein KH142_08650 [Slackia piriformis]|uniref:Phage protein n=1 Tax=Slackia piriformis TaxID=626934 RepID=A0A943UYX3_9ACTN|nr:hypothetical protein [Slackia piriformis]
MARNTLVDLNDHLFAQLERLGEKGLSEEAMKAEIERARAVTGVAQQVIANANTVLRTVEFKDRVAGGSEVPPMLGGGR